MQNGVRLARDILGKMPVKDEKKGDREGRRESSQSYRSDIC